jgi:hypothetical protein
VSWVESGRRDLTFDTWMQLILDYIDKLSVGLYLKVLLTNFLIGLRRAS